MTSVYDSERLAAGYAFDRPPIHEQILRSARLARQADQALDVGCGAGLSTAALAPVARQVTGLEPVNVDNAIARGAYSAEEARDWCRETLKAVFADGEVTIVIPGYVATLARSAGE
jgi:predicted TPR repeat methyltransferase